MTLVAVLAIAAPVDAVRVGQPDNGEHSYVGELRLDQPDDLAFPRTYGVTP